MQTITDTLAEVKIGSMALETVIAAVLTLAVCIVVVKVLQGVTDKALSRAKRLDKTLKGFVRSAVKVLLWLLTAIIVADSLGITTTSLVALVSVAGLALSLSVQNIMSNLFSGITLLIAKPFSTGDYVELGGKSGTVKSVGMFYTVIDDLDNKVISIPNSDVTSGSVTNFSSEPLRRLEMRFEASYDDALSAVKNALLEAIAMDERILAEPEPFVSVSEYKSSSIEYILRVWCKTEDYWPVHFALNEHVKESFDRNCVQMSYEHLNVHIVDK